MCPVYPPCVFTTRNVQVGAPLTGETQKAKFSNSPVPVSNRFRSRPGRLYRRTEIRGGSSAADETINRYAVVMAAVLLAVCVSSFAPRPFYFRATSLRRTALRDSGGGGIKKNGRGTRPLNNEKIPYRCAQKRGELKCFFFKKKKRRGASFPRESSSDFGIIT